MNNFLKQKNKYVLCLRSGSNAPIKNVLIKLCTFFNAILEIEGCWRHLSCRLIGYRPHDHRGVVLIPPHQLLHNNQVMAQRGIFKAASEDGQSIENWKSLQNTFYCRSHCRLKDKKHSNICCLMLH